MIEGQSRLKPGPLPAVVPTTPLAAAQSGRHELLGLWLGLRLMTLVLAALISGLRPLTAAERLVAVWPPSAPIGAWSERVLVLPWLRWDANYYVRIVAHGYRRDDGTAQFHPLLAWLATPLAWVTEQPLLALLLVSSTAGLALLFVFERLALLDLEPAVARTSVLLLLCCPLAFVLFVPYTEPVFLLWAALTLLWARQRHWWLAGLAAALATLTRQQGVLLALPLLWELWEAAGQSARWAWAMRRAWLALGLIPAALVGWLLYRAVALDDLHANLADPQALTYSLLVSPSASKVVPQQALLWPWQALALALSKLWREPELTLAIDLTLGTAFLALLALAWRNLRPSYRLYCAAIVLLSFGYYTGPSYPYMGLPRHLLLALPVFIGAAPAMEGRRRRLAAITAGLCGLCFLLLLYMVEGWTP